MFLHKFTLESDFSKPFLLRSVRGFLTFLCFLLLSNVVSLVRCGT